VSGHGRIDQLLSPIQITVRMPEPDCFLLYRMHWKSHVQVLGMVTRRPSQKRRMVLRRRNTVVGGKCALPSAVIVCFEIAATEIHMKHNAFSSVDYCRPFCVAAPRVWNRLPADLRQLRSTQTFRRHLKTLLFAASYRAPINRHSWTM